jgi:hypothetical protein
MRHSHWWPERQYGHLGARRTGLTDEIFPELNPGLVLPEFWLDVMSRACEAVLD